MLLALGDEYLFSLDSDEEESLNVFVIVCDYPALLEFRMPRARLQTISLLKYIFHASEVVPTIYCYNQKLETIVLRQCF